MIFFNIFNLKDTPNAHTSLVNTILVTLSVAATTGTRNAPVMMSAARIGK